MINYIHKLVLSIVLLLEHQRLLISLLLQVLEDGQAEGSTLGLLLHRELLVLELGPLDLLQPVVVPPHGIVVIGLQVLRLGLSNADGAVHELRLVIVIDCGEGVLALIELDKGIAPHLLGHVVDRYLHGFDFSEGVEEGEEGLLGDCFGQVADVDRALVVVLVDHSLLIL